MTDSASSISRVFPQAILTPQGAAFAFETPSIEACIARVSGNNSAEMTECGVVSGLLLQVTTVDVGNDSGEEILEVANNEVLFIQPNGLVKEDGQYCSENYFGDPVIPAFLSDDLHTDQVCAALDEDQTAPIGAVLAIDNSEREAAIVYGDTVDQQAFTGSTAVLNVNVVADFNKPFDGQYQPFILSVGQQVVVDAAGQVLNATEFCNQNFTAMASSHELPDSIQEKLTDVQGWCEGKKPDSDSGVKIGLYFLIGLPVVLSLGVLFYLKKRCCNSSGPVAQ